MTAVTQHQACGPAQRRRPASRQWDSALAHRRLKQAAQSVPSPVTHATSSDHSIASAGVAQPAKQEADCAARLYHAPRSARRTYTWRASAGAACRHRRRSHHSGAQPFTSQLPGTTNHRNLYLITAARAQGRAAAAARSEPPCSAGPGGRHSTVLQRWRTRQRRCARQESRKLHRSWPRGLLQSSCSD